MVEKSFLIGELFSVKRGKRIVKDVDYFDEKTDEYKYNVITSTTFNNGVDGYYNQFNCDGNSIICGGEASGMFATYQEEPCWAMDRVRVFTPKGFSMNKYIALYFCTIFRMNQYRYCYGRSANPDVIEATKIVLPSSDGINPDFEYIENYIKEKYLTSLKTKNIAIPFSMDDFKWHEYRIDEVFDVIEKCKCGNAGNLVDGNEINYIGAKKKENGFMKKVAIEGNEDKITQGNAIVFICDGQGSVGYSIYQEKPFIGSTTLAVGRNEKLNKYNAMFLVTILDLQRERFSYGRKWGSTLKETVIKLPCDENLNPDWDGMERFIKKMPYGDLL